MALWRGIPWPTQSFGSADSPLRQFAKPWDRWSKKKQIPRFPARRSTNTAKPEYLAAVRQAIEQLGVAATRAELRRRAEQILETIRQ